LQEESGDLYSHLDIKRSKVKVTGLIDAVTESQLNLWNGKAYKLQTSYMDGVPPNTCNTCVTDMHGDLQAESSGWLFMFKSPLAGSGAYCGSPT